MGVFKAPNVMVVAMHPCCLSRVNVNQKDTSGAVGGTKLDHSTCTGHQGSLQPIHLARVYCAWACPRGQRQIGEAGIYTGYNCINFLKSDWKTKEQAGGGGGGSDGRLYKHYALLFREVSSRSLHHESVLFILEEVQ